MGLSIHAGTGLISGIIAADASTQTPYAATVTATAGSHTASVTFQWRVEAVQLDTLPPRYNKVGDTVSVTLTAGTPPGSTPTFSVSGLPTGLSANTAGVISGTVSAGATTGSPHSVTVQATAGGVTVEQTFNWYIADGDLTFSSVSDRTDAAGTAVSLTVSATDPAGHDITYTADGLPPGLSIDGDSGVIGGTISASAQGAYSVTLWADNGQGNTGLTRFTWTVTQANEPPRLITPAHQVGLAGQVVSLTLDAYDVDGDTITFSAVGLPTGLVIDASTGVISGTLPTPASGTQTHSVTVTATTPSNGHSSAVTFPWEVRPANAAGLGTGLLGSYFDDENHTQWRVNRVDAGIDFDWGAGSPAAGVDAETFSVRWQGHVVAPTTGTVTFTVEADDGVRLWVWGLNTPIGQPIVDAWGGNAGAGVSGTAEMVAGQRYAILLEMREATGDAKAKLKWAYGGQAATVVPFTSLFPAHLSLELTQAIVTEGGEVTLSGTFASLRSDVDHEVSVSFGDGSKAIVLVPKNQRLFGVTQPLRDDGSPTENGPKGGNGTASDVHVVRVTVTPLTDDGAVAGPRLESAVALTVQNAAPTRVQVENPLPDQVTPGALVLVTMEDASAGDWYHLKVDWGQETVPGNGNDVTPVDTPTKQPESIHHTYKMKPLLPGDAPITTEYTVTVTANDDDEPNKTVQGTAKVKVQSLPPELDLLVRHRRDGIENAHEGELLTLHGEMKYPGLATWQSVVINWGDGTFSPISPNDPAVLFTTDAEGRVRFTATHQYANDRVLPYEITVVATGTHNGTNYTITKSTTVQVDNVLPSRLTLDVTPQNGNIQHVHLSGTFLDPGISETRRVVIDWDNEQAPQTVHLAAGVHTFTVEHHFAQAPTGDGYRVSVRVLDDAPNGQTNATGKVVIGTPVTADVLTKYAQEAQKVKEKHDGVWEYVYSAAGGFFQITADAANAFLDEASKALDAAVTLLDNLAKLEVELRKFGGNFDRAVKELLRDPARFVRNLFDATLRGFNLYLNDLEANLKDAVFGWIGKQLALFGITLEDVPKDLTNWGQMSGFVMKVLGLTWDDLMARAVEAVGSENIALVTEAFSFVEDMLDNEGNAGAIDPQTLLLKKMSDLAGQLNWESIDPQALATDGLKIAAELVAKQAFIKLTAFVGPMLNPAAGGLMRLFDAVMWLANNGAELVATGNALLERASDIYAGGDVTLNSVAVTVRDALKAAVVLLLDYGAKNLGLNKLAEDAARAIRKLTDPVVAKVSDFMGKLVAKTRDKLTQAWNGYTPAGRAAEDYKGLVGKVDNWKVEDEQHRLWTKVDANGQNARVMLASTPEQVDVTLGKWEDQLKALTTPTAQEQQLLQKVRQAKEHFTKEVKPVLTKVEGVTARIEKEKAKRIADRNAVPRKDVVASKVMATEQKEARRLAKEVNAKLVTIEACAKEMQRWAKNNACFAAGTMLLTPDGHKRIEEFVAGEQILSRSEYDVNGPLEVRVVEKVFRRWGRIWELRVGGEVIRTTGEHPFYEKTKGWVAAQLLVEGDWLAGRDGQ